MKRLALLSAGATALLCWSFADVSAAHSRRSAAHHSHHAHHASRAHDHHTHHYARHRSSSPVHHVSAGHGGFRGIASIYGYRGGRTASGQRTNPHAMTAAHRSLPFGTMVQVTNQHNGRSVVVRINDRGPFVRGRVIDVTPAAAHALGFSGLAPVSLDVVKRSSNED